MATVLVVDDYSVTQRVLGHILRLGGFDSLSAINGLEALEILEEEHIDLVICDIAMPEMDGITLLRRIRADARFSHLPVIMLTASGQDDDRVIAEDAGANGFLTKPASSDDLLNAVSEFLG